MLCLCQHNLQHVAAKATLRRGHKPQSAASTMKPQPAVVTITAATIAAILAALLQPPVLCFSHRTHSCIMPDQVPLAPLNHSSQTPQLKQICRSCQCCALMMYQLQLQGTQALPTSALCSCNSCCCCHRSIVTVITQDPTCSSSSLLSESPATAAAALLRRGRAGVLLAGVWLPSKGSWASTLCRLTWANSAARSSADRPCSPKTEAVALAWQHAGLLCRCPADRPCSKQREGCFHS